MKTTQAKNDSKNLRAPAGGIFSAIALLVIIGFVVWTCTKGIQCGGMLAMIGGAFLIAFIMMPRRGTQY